MDSTDQIMDDPCKKLNWTFTSEFPCATHQHYDQVRGDAEKMLEKIFMVVSIISSLMLVASYSCIILGNSRKNNALTTVSGIFFVNLVNYIQFYFLERNLSENSQGGIFGNYGLMLDYQREFDNLGDKLMLMAS